MEIYGVWSFLFLYEYDSTMRGLVCVPRFRELIVWLTGITVPSSIIGMLLLTLSLKLGFLKLGHVEKVADFLVHNLGFFFVPAGVGLMGCLDLLAAEWIPIVGSVVVSTAVIMAVTGHVHQYVRRRLRARARRRALSNQTVE